MQFQLRFRMCLSKERKRRRRQRLSQRPLLAKVLPHSSINSTLALSEHFVVSKIQRLCKLTTKVVYVSIKIKDLQSKVPFYCIEIRVPQDLPRSETSNCNSCKRHSSDSKTVELSAGRSSTSRSAESHSKKRFPASTDSVVLDSYRKRRSRPHSHRASEYRARRVVIRRDFRMFARLSSWMCFVDGRDVV